jgi:hypothetical protein
LCEAGPASGEGSGLAALIVIVAVVAIGSYDRRPLG